MNKINLQEIEYFKGEIERMAEYFFLENFQKDINVEVESLVNDYKGYTQKKIDIEKKYSVIWRYC